MMKVAVAALTIIVTHATASAEPSAEQLFDEGQQAFDRGDYAFAVLRWQSAYELSKQPLFVLNIAQAYRLAGDCTHALSRYRQFVALDPTSEQRGLADGFISDLEPKCGQQSPSRAGQMPPSVESSDPGRTLRLAGIVTGGAGTAVVVTGLLFGHRASTLGDEVSSACSVSCDWATWRDKDTRGRRDARIGYALDVAGLAAIAGGAVMYYLGRERTVVVVPRTSEGGAVISWSGAW